MTEPQTPLRPTPQEVSDIELAFPAFIEHLMPDDVPDDYPDKAGWIRFQNDWFYHGLPAETEFYLMDGIDGRTAFRHLQAIQGSYAPKHEEKQRAVAWLAGQWFTRIETDALSYPSLHTKTRSDVPQKTHDKEAEN